MNSWFAIEGSPTPLGVTWIPAETCFNFSIYARNASGIILLLFREGNYAEPVAELVFDVIKNRSGRIWHMRVALEDVQDARYYAYRALGEFNPSQGHRYDSQKLLLDPYARGVFFPPGYSRGACTQPGSTMGKAPLGVLPPNNSESYDWTGDVKPPRHQHDFIIYEMHVRGFTRDPSSGVAINERGTYSGIIKKIPYLQELGITAVELLPVHQFDPQEGNYWGYMTLNFFSPHHAYSQFPQRCKQMDEFRDMVKALHQAGIEVILDVVYNHTSETNELGPTYSFRGLDNLTYYLLADNREYYMNDSGTGNVFHTSNRYVRHLIVESLRFWVKEMHVDGFRFDLASIFTRDSNGGVNLIDPPIIAAITSDPDFQDIRLIAEAWDINSYQLGSKFPGISWLQWNGEYRDTVRRFVKGDEQQLPGLMSRIYGSADLFPDNLPDVYHPYQSINFITAHDGFCLYDLVSYHHKRNLANGNNNTDGTDSNFSWNHGWEGDENLPADILQLRKQQIKNLFAILMLSNGTPMFVMGDEFLNTQQGNNNPYNQDNDVSWLNWHQLQQFPDMFRFFKLMINFRKQHPAIGRSRFWRDQVKWYGTLGEVDLASYSRTLAFCILGAAELDDDIYVMINAYWQVLEFRIQEPGDWHLVIDTSLNGPEDIFEASESLLLASDIYWVSARSVAVFIKKRE